MFDLPENWDEMANVKGNCYVYAPNMIEIGEAIMIFRDYASAEISIEDLKGCPRIFPDMMAQFLHGFVENISVEKYGKTCIGNTIKISYEVVTEEGVAKAESYIALDSKSEAVFCISASQMGETELEAFAVTEDILKNGQINPNY